MGQVIRINGLITGDIGFGTVDHPSSGSGGGSTSDSDAQAFINYVTGLTTAQQTAIRTFVTTLKTKELWTKLSAIYPFVGTGSTGRGANLRDLTKNLTYVGYASASENAKGWLGVTGMYAKTGISANWNNNFTFIDIPVAWTGSNIVGVSNDNLANTLAIIRQDSNSTMAAGLGAANYQQFGIAALQGGFLATTNNGSADLYVNGANKKTVTYNPVSTLTQLQIMAYSGGVAIAVGQLLSIVCVGSSYLSASDVTNFNTAVNAFLTSLGRK